jgi:DegV family protein with EDD domain
MITIIADTTSGIPTNLIKKLNIPYIPQIIVFGEETFRDDYEMDPKTFLQRLGTSPVLPKTAAPPPALYNPIYEKYAQDGNTVIVLAPSKELSGTVRSAEVAAVDYPGCDIRIIDTRTLGAGLATMVFEAVKWVEDGTDADTIIARVMEMSNRQKVYFVVDTLEYLHKGGRIGGAKMLMGSILQMKPILQLVNGQIESFESHRTKRRAIARLKELVAADCPHDDKSFISIMHGDVQQEAMELAKEIKSSLGVSTVNIYDLPPAVLVHSGPGVIAISYFTDSTDS